MDLDEVAFVVDGWPPAKNEAKSMLAAGHPFADRVLHLLRAAAVAIGNHKSPMFDGDALGSSSSSTRRRNRQAMQPTISVELEMYSKPKTVEARSRT